MREGGEKETWKQSKEREIRRRRYILRVQARTTRSKREIEGRTKRGFGGIGASDETRREKIKREGRIAIGSRERRRERTARGFGRSAGLAGASVRLETPARTERWLPPLFGTYVRCVPSITPCPPNRSLVNRGSVAQSVVSGVIVPLVRNHPPFFVRSVFSYVFVLATLVFRFVPRTNEKYPRWS